MVRSDFIPSGPLLEQPDSNVVVTILKNEHNGSMTTLRLRSLTGSDEKVRLSWKGRKPVSYSIRSGTEKATDTGPDEEIVVPAYGFVSVDAAW
jgi:hypothetical protein